MKKAKLKLTYVTLEEFNKQLNQIMSFKKETYDYQPFAKSTGYIWTDKKSNIHLVFKDKSNLWKNTHIAIDGYQAENADIAKDKTIKNQDGIGGQAIKWLNRYAKKTGESYDLDEGYVKKLLNINSLDDISVQQYTWADYNYACVQIPYAVSYDMNSCYPYFMTKELPYGNNLGPGLVQDDELGFVIGYSNNSLDLDLKLSGHADFRFKKKTYECFKLWAADGYKKKTDDRSKKTLFNALLGNLKYHNIFIRATVIGYAKNYIKSLKDENTIMQTVDSIVSLKPRTDLDIGTGLGQFKVEHEGTLIFESDSIKTWNDEREIHKGVSASIYVNDHEILVAPQYYLESDKDRFKIVFMKQPTYNIFEDRKLKYGN